MVEKTNNTDDIREQNRKKALENAPKLDAEGTLIDPNAEEVVKLKPWYSRIKNPFKGDTLSEEGDQEAVEIKEVFTQEQLAETAKSLKVLAFIKEKSVSVLEKIKAMKPKEWAQDIANYGSQKSTEAIIKKSKETSNDDQDLVKQKADAATESFKQVKAETVIAEDVKEVVKPIIPMRVIFKNDDIIHDKDASEEAVFDAYKMIKKHLDVEKDGKYADRFLPILENATVRAAKMGNTDALKYLLELPESKTYAPEIWSDVLSADKDSGISEEAKVAAFTSYYQSMKDDGPSKEGDQYIDVVLGQVASPSIRLRDMAFTEATSRLGEGHMTFVQTKKTLNALKDVVKKTQDQDFKVKVAKEITKGLQGDTLEGTPFAEDYSQSMVNVIKGANNATILRTLGGANEMLYKAASQQTVLSSMIDANDEQEAESFLQGVRNAVLLAEANKNQAKGISILEILNENTVLKKYLKENKSAVKYVKGKDSELVTLFAENTEDATKQKPAVSASSENTLGGELNEQIKEVSEKGNDTFEELKVKVGDKTLKTNLGARPKGI